MLESESESRQPFEWDSMGFETTFVENMQSLRERRKMSQTEFARQMQRHGFGFHQPTVARIEAGERPVKLAEAFAIAAVLRTSFESMMQDLSLPFSYDNLIHNTMRRPPGYHVQRLAQVRASAVLDATEIDDSLIDYMKACERFEVEPLKDLVDAAVAVRNTFRKTFQEMYESMVRLQPVVEDGAKELTNKVFPENHHGERTWTKNLFMDAEEDA